MIRSPPDQDAKHSVLRLVYVERKKILETVKGEGNISREHYQHRNSRVTHSFKPTQ